MSCNSLQKLHEPSYFLVADNDKLLSWDEASTRCMDRYGSPLATLITDDDFASAIKLFQNSNINITEDVKMYIGLYKNAANTSKWQWASGIHCDEGRCIDNDYWNVVQSDSSYEYQVGTFLQFSANKVSLKTLSASSSRATYAYLCDGQQYSFPNCTA
eukprot:205378_1